VPLGRPLTPGSVKDGGTKSGSPPRPRTLAGPAFAAVYTGVPKLLVGFLLQNPVSFAYTSSDRPAQNTLAVQPAILIHLWDGFYLRSADATWVYGWRHHSPTLLPLSLGVGRVMVRPGGVGHHVALSVVGTERLQESGYFRAKMVQENLIKASRIPYTIVRATQFFEFMGGIAQFSTVGQTVHLPPALWQPIAADDVASALAEVSLGAPVNGMIEIAGPERAGLDELVGRFLGATKDPREVITDVDARYYGLVVNDQSLTPGANPRIGATSFEDWLNRYITQKES